MTMEKIRQEKFHYRDVKKNTLGIAVKQSRHSYLYTEPFEPVVHGTFGIDQPKTLDMFIIRKIEDLIQIIDQIRDFFAEIIVGSRGFSHPHHVGSVPF
ncbi:hypothetical protein C2G38_2232090 [Gigaspora rosea]|uniref:Uncharacterized protein n=1 Tax=Gigaspora rosea TaxID=44941 RepID=A0A397TXA2_9GLOM|nr:hypothetical protein C2G38_2232090 [Gigaspora rosea]